ncbi:MAG: hypothetical protein HFJ65_02690 [Eggerthellaceae bacterium]|nr:hypothetical protein [Eggerthellaceae bacterium]
MLYLGIISYIDPYKDDDYGNSKDSMVFMTLIVEAQDADVALKRMRKKLVDLHDEDEMYYSVHEFFLEDLVELDRIGSEAKDVSWMSLHPFGDSFMQMRYYKTDDPAFRHYVIRDLSGSLRNPSGPDPAVDIAPIPIEDDDEEGEMVPLLSIDRDRHQTRPLYKELCKRKFQNTLPNFKDLTDGDLYELYVVEGCLSSEIADLFEIKKSKVDYRRRRIGATLADEVEYDLLRSLGVIDPIPYKDPNENSRSQDAQ